MKRPAAIVGAGLAGLIAGHIWPGTPIYERNPDGHAEHKALLRFRSMDISNLTGIPFRAVTVRKGIFFDGQHVAPNIALANRYAAKVLPGGIVADRSIWALEPVTRFIAPENFYAQLLERVGRDITWEADAAELMRKARELQRPVISTAPMAVAVRSLFPSAEAAPLLEQLAESSAPITVERYRLPGARLNQTLYFPGDETLVYRASMTDEVLIVESVERPTHFAPEDADERLELVAEAFGLLAGDFKELGARRQSYGKIVPLDDAQRKAVLFRLTHEHNVYSFGRFATWRNLLLDDLVQDGKVIRQLLENAGSYDLSRAAAR